MNNTQGNILVINKIISDGGSFIYSMVIDGNEMPFEDRFLCETVYYQNGTFTLYLNGEWLQVVDGTSTTLSPTSGFNELHVINIDTNNFNLNNDLYTASYASHVGLINLSNGNVLSTLQKPYFINLKQAEEAKLKEQEEAKLKEEQLKKEKEEQLKKEQEEVKLKEEAKLKEQEKAKLKEQEEAKLKEEQLKKEKEEQEVKLKEEQEVKLKEEQEVKLKEEQLKKEQEEVKLKEEQEIKLKEEQEASKGLETNTQSESVSSNNSDTVNKEPIPIRMIDFLLNASQELTTNPVEAVVKKIKSNNELLSYVVTHNYIGFINTLNSDDKTVGDLYNDITELVDMIFTSHNLSREDLTNDFIEESLEKDKPTLNVGIFEFKSRLESLLSDFNKYESSYNEQVKGYPNSIDSNKILNIIDDSSLTFKRYKKDKSALNNPIHEEATMTNSQREFITENNSLKMEVAQLNKKIRDLEGVVLEAKISEDQSNEIESLKKEISKLTNENKEYSKSLLEMGSLVSDREASVKGADIHNSQLREKLNTYVVNEDRVQNEFDAYKETAEKEKTDLAVELEKTAKSKEDLLNEYKSVNEKYMYLVESLGGDSNKLSVDLDGLIENFKINNNSTSDSKPTNTSDSVNLIPQVLLDMLDYTSEDVLNLDEGKIDDIKKLIEETGDLFSSEDLNKLNNMVGLWDKVEQESLDKIEKETNEQVKFRELLNTVLSITEEGLNTIDDATMSSIISDINKITNLSDLEKQNVNNLYSKWQLISQQNEIAQESLQQQPQEQQEQQEQQPTQQEQQPTQQEQQPTQQEQQPTQQSSTSYEEFGSELNEKLKELSGPDKVDLSRVFIQDNHDKIEGFLKNTWVNEMTDTQKRVDGNNLLFNKFDGQSIEPSLLLISDAYGFNDYDFRGVFDEEIKFTEYFLSEFSNELPKETVIYDVYFNILKTTVGIIDRYITAVTSTTAPKLKALIDEATDMKAGFTYTREMLGNIASDSFINHIVDLCAVFRIVDNPIKEGLPTYLEYLYATNNLKTSVFVNTQVLQYMFDYLYNLLVRSNDVSMINPEDPTDIINNPRFRDYALNFICNLSGLYRVGFFIITTSGITSANNMHELMRLIERVSKLLLHSTVDLSDVEREFNLAILSRDSIDLKVGASYSKINPILEASTVTTKSRKNKKTVNNSEEVSVTEDDLMGVEDVEYSIETFDSVISICGNTITPYLRYAYRMFREHTGLCILDNKEYFKSNSEFICEIESIKLGSEDFDFLIDKDDIESGLIEEDSINTSMKYEIVLTTRGPILRVTSDSSSKDVNILFLGYIINNYNNSLSTVEDLRVQEYFQTILELLNSGNQELIQSFSSGFMANLVKDNYLVRWIKSFGTLVSLYSIQNDLITSYEESPSTPIQLTPTDNYDLNDPAEFWYYDFLKSILEIKEVGTDDIKDSLNMINHTKFLSSWLTNIISKLSFMFATDYNDSIRRAIYSDVVKDKFTLNYWHGATILENHLLSYVCNGNANLLPTLNHPMALTNSVYRIAKDNSYFADIETLYNKRNRSNVVSLLLISENVSNLGHMGRPLSQYNVLDLNGNPFLDESEDGAYESQSMDYHYYNINNKLMETSLTDERQSNKLSSADFVKLFTAEDNLITLSGNKKSDREENLSSDNNSTSGLSGFNLGNSTDNLEETVEEYEDNVVNIEREKILNSDFPYLLNNIDENNITYYLTSNTDINYYKNLEFETAVVIKPDELMYGSVIGFIFKDNNRIGQLGELVFIPSCIPNTNKFKSFIELIGWDLGLGKYDINFRNENSDMLDTKLGNTQENGLYVYHEGINSFVLKDNLTIAYTLMDLKNKLNRETMTKLSVNKKDILDSDLESIQLHTLFSRLLKHERYENTVYAIDLIDFQNLNNIYIIMYSQYFLNTFLNIIMTDISTDEYSKLASESLNDLKLMAEEKIELIKNSI